MASNLPASKSGLYADPREDWLALHSEDVIDPARPIVDPHHHLWDRGGQRYLIDELAAEPQWDPSMDDQDPAKQLPGEPLISFQARTLSAPKPAT